MNLVVEGNIQEDDLMGVKITLDSMATVIRI